jgi:hypothetical protein
MLKKKKSRTVYQAELDEISPVGLSYTNLALIGNAIFNYLFVKKNIENRTFSSFLFVFPFSCIINLLIILF